MPLLAWVANMCVSNCEIKVATPLHVEFPTVISRSSYFTCNWYFTCGERGRKYLSVSLNMAALHNVRLGSQGLWQNKKDTRRQIC